MICKFCGTENVNDAIFCSSCGKRIDGNKVCSSCGKTISEQSVFCSYCGARVDGKKICASCGAEVEHAFCTQCGTPYGEQGAKQTVGGDFSASQKAKEKITYQKTSGILTPTLMLAALFVLFVCSFFIGTSSTIFSEGIRLGRHNQGAFYFLGKVFDDVKLIVETYEEGAGAGLYVPTILTTVAVAASLIVSLTMLIIGAVKYGKGMLNKQSVCISKYAIWSFATFAFAVFMVLSVHAYGSEGENFQFKVAASDGSLAGLILGAIFIVGGLIFSYTAKKEFAAKDVAAMILTCACFVLAMVLLSIVSSNCVKYVDEYGERIIYSPSRFLQLFLSFGEADPYRHLQYEALLVGVGYAFAVLTIVSACLLVAFTLHSLKKKNGGWVMLAVSIVTAVFAVAYMVMQIVARAYANNSVDADLYNADYATLGGPIAVAVLALVALGIAIALVVVKQKKERTNELSN